MSELRLAPECVAWLRRAGLEVVDRPAGLRVQDAAEDLRFDVTSHDGLFRVDFAERSERPQPRVEAQDLSDVERWLMLIAAESTASGSGRWTSPSGDRPAEGTSSVVDGTDRVVHDATGRSRLRFFRISEHDAEWVRFTHLLSGGLGDVANRLESEGGR